jgi:hypothetical protein
MKNRSCAKDQKLADNARLLRAWRKWHGEQLEEALAGVHRDVVERLLAQLKDLRSTRELLAFIEAQDWARDRRRHAPDRAARDQQRHHQAARAKRLAADRRRAGGRAAECIPADQIKTVSARAGSVAGSLIAGP